MFKKKKKEVKSTESLQAEIVISELNYNNSIVATQFIIGKGECIFRIRRSYF